MTDAQVKPEGYPEQAEFGNPGLLTSQLGMACVSTVEKTVIEKEA